MIAAIVPYNTQKLQIIGIPNDPIVQIKVTDCKIQMGSLKIIHPVNLTKIEESIEIITNSFYNKLTPTNPLQEVIKYRIKKLYSTLYGLKPERAHRFRRWDSLGTAWKWVAGSPDAQDLQIINLTMNNIIEQNNYQYQINQNIDKRVTQLTYTINRIVNSLNDNKDSLDTLDAVTTMLNIDVINELLDNIQEAITLTKISIANNKMLSTREVNVIKSALQEQGVKINFPDEALQFVTPKIAVRNNDLLYILHVPQLENSTSTITRIYPLIVDNQIIKSFPSYIIRQGTKLYTTGKPNDFVQRSADINEFEDECIKTIILGKQSRCPSIFKNDTIQQLVNENTIIISNAKNQTLKTNCGPDDRTISGNFILKFYNCTIQFNQHTFQSSESIIDTEILHGTSHKSLIEWNLHKHNNIAEIGDVAIGNRRKLDHVYLQQNRLHFKLWTTFGGLSLTTVSCFIIVILLLKNINPCSKNWTYCKGSPETEPGRFDLKEGEVTVELNLPPESSNMLEQLKSIKQQQQQLLAALGSIPHNP